MTLPEFELPKGKIVIDTSSRKVSYEKTPDFSSKASPGHLTGFGLFIISGLLYLFLKK